MPTYDYACPACGGFDAFRSLSQRNESAACPGCEAAAPRVFASAPRLALLAGDTRRAMDVNERARHAPKSSRDVRRLRYPAGCGCCSGAAGKRSAMFTAPNGAKAFPARRPWMISH